MKKSLVETKYEIFYKTKKYPDLSELYLANKCINDFKIPSLIITTSSDNETITVSDWSEDSSVTVLDSSGNEISITNNNNGTYTLEGVAGDYTVQHLNSDNSWSELTQDEANEGITTLESAIDSLSATIQRMGDYQARLTSKEESLSIGVTNTEASRSRIEDADFAKEQMEMIKLQILQQTGVSAFSQANSAPQVVLSLFR